MRPLPGSRVLANVVIGLLAVVVIGGGYYVVTENRTAAGDSAVVPAPTSSPVDAAVRAVFFGDSIVAGANAGPGNPIFADVAAASLGWRVNLFGFPGTGYTTAGRYKGAHDYYVRLQQLRGYDIDVLVLEGGINDSRATPTVLRARVEAVLDEARDLVPRAQVVLMGPWQPSGTPEPPAVRVEQVLASVAAERHLPFVDPIAEKWITGRFPSSENAATMIAEDGLYPNQAGHQYFGERLAADLRTLLPARLVKPRS